MAGVKYRINLEYIPDLLHNGSEKLSRERLGRRESKFSVCPKLCAEVLLCALIGRRHGGGRRVM